MSSFTSSFCIRFIRNSKGSASSDDRISVRKDLATGEFQVTYRDENNGEPVTHQMNYLYRARVMDHFYLLLKNQMIDDDGFEAVQFNMPAMPRMLANADKFKDVYYREHFLDLIGNALDCLDTVESVGPRKARTPAPAPKAVAVPTSSQDARDQAWLEADLAEARARKAKADGEASWAASHAAEMAALSAARVATSRARMPVQAQDATPTPTPTSYFYNFRYDGEAANPWHETQTPMDVETSTQSSVRRSPRISSRRSSSIHGDEVEA